MTCSLAFQFTDLAACSPNSTIFSVQYTTLILTLLTLFSFQRIPNKSFVSFERWDFNAKRGRDSELHPKSGIPESGEILLVESRIQLKEFGISLRIGIQDPSSIDKDWNPKH